MKKYLPLFHNCEGRHALVVGGGAVAQRRCRTLVEHGFRVHVVSPEILDGLKDYLEQSGNTYELIPWSDSKLTQPAIVVAATDNTAVNQSVAQAAAQKHIPVNVVNDSDLCDFIFPSIIEREPLSIAVTASGASPVLARLLKNLINGLVPASYGKLAELVGRYRKPVRAAIDDEKKRVAFWEVVLQGPIAEAIFSGKDEEAQALLEHALKDPDKTIASGEVYLIGAGPGDPGLLTMRAFRLIQQADVVLYDRLVSDEVMALVRPNAEKIYVGKQRDDHAVPQQEINHLLVEHAKKGKRVARLKGGDPFIFGRGGEEIEQLSSEQVPFQVIPGITAANGCASYAGIPLTHRDHAQSVRFVTGQLKDGTVNLDWEQLIQPSQTVVFYMGLKGLSVISQSLIEHGADKHLPVALIEQGTTAEQRVHVGTLETIAGIVDQATVKSPTLLIVGSVVSLHETLRWFES